MEFTYNAVLPLDADEAFERLRHFLRVYPDLHAAHDPHPPGFEPPLLALGLEFMVGERFGPQVRTYAFRVVAFDPAARAIGLTAVTTTQIGPVRITSDLLVEWLLEAGAHGTHFLTRQTVTTRPPWLAPLLLNRRAIQAHVDEETIASIALLTSPDWPA